MKTTILAAVMGVFASGALADGHLISVPTDKSVAEAMDSLEAAVTNAGATVFARVDHQAGAASVDLEMDHAQTLIFGNPKLGTPAMVADPRASLFLPLKVAAYALPEGGVAFIYEDPAAMLGEVGIESDAPFVKMMQGALGKLTSVAAN